MEVLPKGGTRSRPRKVSPEASKKNDGKKKKVAARAKSPPAAVEEQPMLGIEPEEDLFRDRIYPGYKPLGPDAVLDFDTPRLEDASMQTPQFVTIDWDALKSDFLAERKMDKSLLFANTAEQKDRFRAVDHYAIRLPDRKAHKLRMLVEVGVHCQLVGGDEIDIELL